MAATDGGKIFILSAPSGAGKSSLARALVKETPDLALSISHTTRPPRPGEQHGVHYYFVTPGEFQSMARDGYFLEHAQVFGNYYGTARQAVEELLKRGKRVVFDIDWQGARRIKALMPEVKSVFILPPSRAVLEQRLCNRGQDTQEVIARRMHAATAEMRHYREFDHVIVNDDFDAALADLQAIVRGTSGKVRPLGMDPALLLHE